MSPAELEELKLAVKDWADPGPVKSADALLAGLDDVSAMTVLYATRTLPRLLEERERLLEALDEAEEAHGGECVGVDKCHMRQRMQAAIAFAEAPAGKEGAPPTPPAP